MTTYIHELPDWPHFRWDEKRLAAQVAAVRHRQGRILGTLEGLGITLREEAILKTLTEEVIKSSEIEGEILDREQVRSSLARRLGIDIGALKPEDRRIEGIVDMILDATQNYRQPLTAKRLCGWHAAFFPTGYSGLYQITVGRWRTEESGPIRVVSGPIGRERTHFEAPEATRLEVEMATFLEWIEDKTIDSRVDPVLRAAIAHLWFVTLHPLEDGNGRIGRAIIDMMLARSEESGSRFYSMSAQIRKERGKYYDALERAQKGDLEITGYLEWFLGCLERAFVGAETVLKEVLRKARFWKQHSGEAFNARQRAILNRLMDGFEGKLTSSKWAKIAKCSQDTASRDIEDLIKKHILRSYAVGSLTL
ncbi:Filamentation induced by cAMP protein Fic [Candidatus Competibacter denitrificans Run_A_D11]|uniref:Filamentation induced by cAMP protein Fic n=1 Tax=Candidatus Competibacter denitrificans Run_A_D11 TaxID=1400863 RepID=W6M727_9GAMM|nr:Fic family protein [Candidatus Competibacter denitrificans]CDI03492.1 Filamentation induced by cAMP protein Fic [Candidatus Competibacter denitrificans Run_A_D11]